MRHVKNTIMSKAILGNSMGNKPFIIGNVWSAKSARIAEKHYKALGISGHAIAENLGYATGKMSFEGDVYSKTSYNGFNPGLVDIDGGRARYDGEPEHEKPQMGRGINTKIR